MTNQGETDGTGGKPQAVAESKGIIEGLLDRLSNEARKKVPKWQELPDSYFVQVEPDFLMELTETAAEHHDHNVKALAREADIPYDSLRKRQLETGKIRVQYLRALAEVLERHRSEIDSNNIEEHVTTKFSGPRSLISLENLELAKTLYQDWNLSHPEIGRFFNCHPETIRKQLIKHGTPSKTPGLRRLEETTEKTEQPYRKWRRKSRIWTVEEINSGTLTIRDLFPERYPRPQGETAPIEEAGDYWIALLSKDIIDTIKKRIKEEYPSQRAFATAIGLTSNTVTRWLKGRHSPSVANIRKIADALELDLTGLTAAWPNAPRVKRPEDYAAILNTKIKATVKLITGSQPAEPARKPLEEYIPEMPMEITVSGETIRISKRKQSFSPEIGRGTEVPAKINEAVAELYGIALGDGMLGVYPQTPRPNKPPGYHYVIQIAGHPVDDKFYYDYYVAPLMQSLFGIPIEPKRLEQNSYGIRFQSKTILLYMHDTLALPIGPKEQFQRLSETIIQAGESCTRAALRGLVDTDFAINFQRSSRGIHQNPSLAANFANKNLARELVKLFDRIGHKFTVRYDVPVVGGYITNRLWMTGTENIRNLIEDIGLSNPKQLLKWEIYRKYGFCPPTLTPIESIAILEGALDPKSYYETN